MFFNPTGHEALIQPIGRDFGEVSFDYDDDDDDDDDDDRGSNYHDHVNGDDHHLNLWILTKTAQVVYNYEAKCDFSFYCKWVKRYQENILEYLTIEV